MGSSGFIVIVEHMAWSIDALYLAVLLRLAAMAFHIVRRGIVT